MLGPPWNAASRDCITGVAERSGRVCSAKTQDRTIEILSQLIGYASVSSESNNDIVEYIEGYLSDYGIASRRIPDATGAKASLLATIGPTDRPGVVLSAHTDVVPVEGQVWSSPPFVASRVGNRLVGRGATDMKGFIASVLANIPCFKEAATATPVHIAFSYDEEIGCRGTPDLVTALSELPRPALCVVGEPTRLRVVRAHKGKVARRLVVTGRGGHSALPHRAANAVVAAARIATSLAAFADRLAQTDARDASFDPPYTTLHVASLHGGSALNFVPDRAVLEFEIRYGRGADVSALLREIDAELDAARAGLQQNAPEADVAVEEIISYPAFAIAANHPALATVARLAGDDMGAGAVSFGTEAGFYAAAGIPTVVCGPGDIVRAHKPDEWIGLDELAGADQMMRRLAAQLSAPIENWLRA
jgi:acetylornithine deacetylase